MMQQLDYAISFNSIKPQLAAQQLDARPHLDTVLIITRPKRSAGVLACGFERRLAARIQRMVGPGSETLP